ncbi:MAG: DUF1570 domain-containing protein [Planctomycetota bacterium]|nr:MAG: DUF1570 domain-containing protein [Planctomycetota bacterium]
MKSQVIIAVLLFFAAGTARAAKFKSYESGVCTFRLHGCELTRPVERAIVFGVSRIFETYRQSFGFSYPDNFKIQITIFINKDRFVEYQKEQGKKSIADSAYYSVRFREGVVYWRTYSKKTKDAKDMVSAVFHEVSHMLLMTEVRGIPLWINEGLAEYFDGLNVFGENRRVYLHEHHHRWIKRWNRNSFPVELDEYLSLKHKEWHKLNREVENCNAAYTMGYSLVYFMMSRSSTEKVLKELLWDFKRHGRKANSIAIINKHYRGGLENFEKQWRKWIPKARSYRPLRSLRTHSERTKEDADKNSQAANSNSN